MTQADSLASGLDRGARGDGCVVLPRLDHGVIGNDRVVALVVLDARQTPHRYVEITLAARDARRAHCF